VKISTMVKKQAGFTPEQQQAKLKELYNGYYKCWSALSAWERDPNLDIGDFWVGDDPFFKMLRTKYVEPFRKGLFPLRNKINGLMKDLKAEGKKRGVNL